MNFDLYFLFRNVFLFLCFSSMSVGVSAAFEGHVFNQKMSMSSFRWGGSIMSRVDVYDRRRGGHYIIVLLERMYDPHWCRWVYNNIIGWCIWLWFRRAHVLRVGMRHVRIRKYWKCSPRPLIKNNGMSIEEIITLFL